MASPSLSLNPPKRCEQQQPKTGCVGEVLGKPPLIAGASTSICTRVIFGLLRCARISTAIFESLPNPYSPLRAPAFFRISRNRVQANNPHSFEMNSVACLVCVLLCFIIPILELPLRTCHGRFLR